MRLDREALGFLYHLRSHHLQMVLFNRLMETTEDLSYGLSHLSHKLIFTVMVRHDCEYQSDHCLCHQDYSVV